MEYFTLRNLLVLYSAAAFIITLSYLRYRRCSALEVALWGTLALILPIFGPFFVIAARPGPNKRRRNRAAISLKG